MATEETASTGKKPTTPLGFWRGWSLVVGGTIGSGIFTLPALLAPYGLLGLVGWFIAGSGALLMAFMLARLSIRMPAIGGPYAYARAGLGDFVGFWVGWGYWIAIWSATAAIAVACVGYISFFLPILRESSLLAAIATLTLIWSLTAMNIHSMGSSGGFQLLTTFLKILPLLFVGLLGFSAGSTDNLPPFNPSGGSLFAVIATSVTLVMWAFVGLEGGTVPAADMVEPQKTIPRILIFGTLTVLVVYLVAFSGVMLLLPAEMLSNSPAPFADATVKVIGTMGASLIAMGAMISTLGALNAQVLLSGQVVRAVALDGLFPKILSKLGVQGTPFVAIIVSSILASILVAMNYTKGLVEAFNMMILLSTLTTLVPLSFAAIAALIFLKRDDASASRSQGIIVAVLAFLYSLLVIIGAGAETVFYGFILLTAAMPIYVLVAKNRDGESQNRI
ncbi:amino acid permease [Pseudomonadales bacterium]|nr:amino acid permease [Pseudomonadales bacterium]MDB2542217.1 amino acid permease [Pseudomonadales bacterium]MDC0994527.1 amino acid permease [Pseudomonadales bacterium]MDC3357920.1 amino acid permease [Pseudomonadales bacterium]MDG0999174.1 amino acid permease [Pseudomonadales bacterium]